MGACELQSNVSKLFHHQRKMHACNDMYSVLPTVCMQQPCQCVGLQQDTLEWHNTSSK